MVAGFHVYPNYNAEIFLDDVREFKVANRVLLNKMRKIYGDRWKLQQIPKNILSSNIRKNWGSYRWLIKPSYECDLIYIGDIDILIVPESERLDVVHSRIIDKTGLPYSNIVRPLTSKNKELKITGLHCVKTQEYYEKVDTDWILRQLISCNGKICDEVLLYKAMVKFFGNPTTNKKRPVHGIHMSPGRPVVRPIGKKCCHWGISKQRAQGYLKLKESEIWKELYPYFSIGYQKKIQQLEGGLKELQRRGMDI